MEQKPNPLLARLAKQKAEAKKNGGNTAHFEKFQAGKSRFDVKLKVGPTRGGRNGQGKP